MKTKRVIYSIFVKIPKEEHFKGSHHKNDSQIRAEKTISGFDKHYDRLLENKRSYAKEIGVPFKMFTYDKQYQDYQKMFKKDYPEISEYNIVNFYKIHLLYELAKKYDEILYLDFDVVTLTKDNFFEENDLSKGIYVLDNNKSVNKMRVAIDKINHGIRSPSAKYYNCQAMLIHEGYGPYNDVINTGIVGASSDNLKKLDYFGEFKQTLNLMSKLKKDGFDFFPPNITRMFGHDNETIFSYKIQKSGVNIEWFNDVWHYFYDKDPVFGMYIPDRCKFCHVVNKDFDYAWRKYEKNNL